MSRSPDRTWRQRGPAKPGRGRSAQAPAAPARAGGAAGRGASVTTDLSLPQQASDRWGQSPRPRAALGQPVCRVRRAERDAGHGPEALHRCAEPVADGLPERSSGAAASPAGRAAKRRVAGEASSLDRRGFAATADGRLRPPATVQLHITDYITEQDRRRLYARCGQHE